jgi:hypothetical protein
MAEPTSGSAPVILTKDKQTLPIETLIKTRATESTLQSSSDSVAESLPTALKAEEETTAVSSSGNSELQDDSLPPSSSRSSSSEAHKIEASKVGVNNDVDFDPSSEIQDFDDEQVKS